MGQGVQGESRTRRERLGPGLMRVAAPAGDAVGPLLLPMNKGGRCFTALGRDACSGAKLPKLLPSPRILPQERGSKRAPPLPNIVRGTTCHYLNAHLVRTGRKVFADPLPDVVL